MAQQHDHDTPWKEALSRYLPQFFAFFFPALHADIDWSRRVVFLDKELRRIAPEVPGGSRVADHLIRVHRKSGEIRWVLVHIEVQSQKVSDFARRMLQYHLRIMQRHENWPVCSLAILGDPSADWRPESHDQALWGIRLRFEFPVVKLLDYRGRLPELERSTNPFALLVAATLHVHVTSPKDPRRRKAKLRLVVGLYDAGLSAA